MVEVIRRVGKFEVNHLTLKGLYNVVEYDEDDSIVALSLWFDKEVFDSLNQHDDKSFEICCQSIIDETNY